MTPASAWTAAALLMVALSGCMGGGTDAGPTPTPVPPTPTPTPTAAPTPAPQPLDADDELTGCAAVLSAHSTSFTQAEAHLPPGFVAADLAELLRIQDVAFLGRAVVAQAAVECGHSQSLGGPSEFALLLVAVRPPDLVVDPGPTWLDLYVTQVWARDSTADFWTGHNWTVRDGMDLQVIIQVHEDPLAASDQSRRPHVLIGQSFGYNNGTDAWETLVVGGGTYHTSDPDGGADVIRLWHTTSQGLVHADLRVSDHAVSGAAECSYYDAELAGLVGPDDCDTTVVLGIAIPASDMGLSMRHLPGIFA